MDMGLFQCFRKNSERFFKDYIHPSGAQVAPERDNPHTKRVDTRLIEINGGLLVQRVVSEQQPAARALPRKLLFVYDLDLLVEHLAGKPINRDVHPVMLLALDNEIALETIGIWFVAT